jgi:PHP family Zn ribbon phosphoesterase
VRFAADLHLHSRYSSAVSPAMTLENIALWAQRKGVDLLGTGDGLQPQWLAEIEAHTTEAEPGLRMLRPEIEEAVHAKLPEGLRRSLRFVLSAEVNCVPAGTDKMAGLHQLLYFPSLAVAREFAARVGKRGDLQDGRPDLALSARELLKGTRNFDRVWQAPAHVMNPWFSALGIIGGETSLEAVYGEELPHLLAVETGLTSDPSMCRRVPSLDDFGLFSCSDAHSLDNLGRECTLLDIEPSYDALMAALRAGTNDRVLGARKMPLALTRHYLNWCSACQTPFEAMICPQCSRKLTMGSRARLEKLDGVRAAPVWPANRPPFEALAPLADVIGLVKNKNPEGAGVRREASELIDQLGRHERFILTEASAAELVRVTTPEIAGAILRQRSGEISRFAGAGSGELGQGGFGF